MFLYRWRSRLRLGLFNTQVHTPVPEPFRYDQALRFVRAVGAQRATLHMQNVLGVLSWGHTLKEIVPRIQEL
jgi:hypothetical protein